MQRSFSRKGSLQRGNEKKINPSSPANDRDANIGSSASPRGKQKLRKVRTKLIVLKDE